MIVAGIDPGKGGGIAVRLASNSWVTLPMPLIGGEIDVDWIASLMGEYQVERVVIEKQQSMPKQGVASTFTIGRNYGMILGGLKAARVPYQEVTSKSWKAKVLKGTKKDKDAAIAYANRIAPGVDLTPGRRTVPHDGIADAVCMADYALMQGVE